MRGARGAPVRTALFMAVNGPTREPVISDGGNRTDAPTELQRQLLNLREHCEETRRCLHRHARRHGRTATALEATMGLCGLGTAVLTFAGMNTAATALAFATAASAAVNIGVLRGRDNEAGAARLAGTWQRDEQDAARLL